MVATITIMFQDVFELKNHKIVILSLVFCCDNDCTDFSVNIPKQS